MITWIILAAIAIIILAVAILAFLISRVRFPQD